MQGRRCLFSEKVLCAGVWFVFFWKEGCPAFVGRLAYARTDPNVSSSFRVTMFLVRFWKDGRVVEGACLECKCAGNSTVGSNPTPSAKFFLCLCVQKKVLS